jgi:ornithine cyclodeaminase/alanine dehydrogenase-like protein (mu-crystallin family)
VAKGIPAGSGIFVVCDATNGAPLGVFQENRYLTDLRTGAAGAVAVKHFTGPKHTKVAFIGTGVIANAMAEATAQIHGFEQGLLCAAVLYCYIAAAILLYCYIAMLTAILLYCYTTTMLHCNTATLPPPTLHPYGLYSLTGYAFGLDSNQSQDFCDTISSTCGYPMQNCASAEEAVRAADVIFTQTPGSATVLELAWLKPHATIIASGSDQPSKNELPVDVMRASKFVTDLTRQCSRVGELRTALLAGMTEAEVHAELGEVVNGTKAGREGDELIVVDLTGTGAQDAAIGQVAWDTLSKL